MLRVVGREAQREGPADLVGEHLLVKVEMLQGHRLPAS